MFAPTKIWRKWHVKVNQGQKYVDMEVEIWKGWILTVATGASLLLPLLLPPLWLPS